jgi:hypothetical protein
LPRSAQSQDVPVATDSGERRPSTSATSRAVALAAMGIVLAGAGYLIAVRGEAIVADLAKLGSSVFCF